MCGRIMVGSCSDWSRIGFPHCKWGFNCFFVHVWSTEFHCDLQTLGSFPQCKWDCKWCWWMSCRWSCEGSLARNAFLRDQQMHETLCFSTQSASPNLDDLPLRCDGCETVSCVVGSWSDHARIGLGSVPHCKWGFNCFSCTCGRQNSIVICNCRIVPAM